MQSDAARRRRPGERHPNAASGRGRSRRCSRCQTPSRGIRPRPVSASGGDTRPPAAQRPRSSTRSCRPPPSAQRPRTWEEAIALYAKAVKLRPDFVEGYWYQGTAYYTLDKFPECRDAFRRVTRLSPKNGGRSRSWVCASSASRTTTARCSTCCSRASSASATRISAASRAITPRIIMTRIEQYEQALADARRVRRGGERQPACDRSHGHRHAADGDAAERSAA